MSPCPLRYEYEGYVFVEMLAKLMQVIETIVINIANDTDLLNFILACKDFAFAILIQSSTVWRTRFLSSYDHPIIEDSDEFRIAYQLREMVLRKFPSFADGGGARGQAALEVLRDMVLGMPPSVYCMVQRPPSHLLSDHLGYSPLQIPTRNLPQTTKSTMWLFPKSRYTLQPRKSSIHDQIPLITILHPRDCQVRATKFFV